MKFMYSVHLGFLEDLLKRLESYRHDKRLQNREEIRKYLKTHEWKDKFFDSEIEIVNITNVMWDIRKRINKIKKIHAKIQKDTSK